MCDDAEQLIDSPDATVRALIAPTLRRFGAGAIALAAEQRIRIVGLRSRERYSSASPVLRRMGVDVDAWSSPPAGLFVVEERTVYLRAFTAMAVAHEFAHGLDCALGGGVYRSGYDPAIRDAFGKAERYVTPYAACSIDEYFAESMRAYVGVNDPASLWPRVTRERLRAIDATIHDILAAVFERELAMHTTPA